MRNVFLAFLAAAVLCSCSRNVKASKELAEKAGMEHFEKAKATELANDFKSKLAMLQRIQKAAGIEQTKEFPVSFGSRSTVNLCFVVLDDGFAIGTRRQGITTGEHTFVYSEKDSTGFYFNGKEAQYKMDFKSFSGEVDQLVSLYDEQHPLRRASL
ncbi:MAG: hypothetical protein JWM20_390 [Patescibacteria group bacterium]|nr:hypothetical protein [Patescibacteria group bacterium]